MSVAVWPPELPRPNRTGWQAQLQDPRQKRNADTGPMGSRRRFSSVARNVALSVSLTRSEKGRFDRFIEDDLRHGARVFLMPDPTTDGWPLLTSDGLALLAQDGSPILAARQWLCLLGDDMPREIIRGLQFQISFSVQVMP